MSIRPSKMHARVLEEKKKRQEMISNNGWGILKELGERCRQGAHEVFNAIVEAVSLTLEDDKEFNLLTEEERQQLHANLVLLDSDYKFHFQKLDEIWDMHKHLFGNIDHRQSTPEEQNRLHQDLQLYMTVNGEYEKITRATDELTRPHALLINEIVFKCEQRMAARAGKNEAEEVVTEGA